MRIEVRKAGIQDAPALYQLNREFNGEDVSTVGEIADSLQTNMSEIVMIVLAAGRPAGFVCGHLARSMCYRAPHGEIGELYVREQYRRSGVGKALMQAMEQSFARSGAQVVTLETSINNEGAQHFYEACGYAGKMKWTYRKKL
jgi:ribosomal protein S18 acetylase RimI-like enzyme